MPSWFLERTRSFFETPGRADVLAAFLDYPGIRDPPHLHPLRQLLRLVRASAKTRQASSTHGAVAAVAPKPGGAPSRPLPVAPSAHQSSASAGGAPPPPPPPPPQQQQQPRPGEKRPHAAVAEGGATSAGPLSSRPPLSSLSASRGAAAVAVAGGGARSGGGAAAATAAAPSRSSSSSGFTSNLRQPSAARAPAAAHRHPAASASAAPAVAPSAPPAASAASASSAVGGVGGGGSGGGEGSSSAHNRQSDVAASTELMKSVKLAFQARGADEGAYKAFKETLRRCARVLKAATDAPMVEAAEHEARAREALAEMRQLFAPPQLAPLAPQLRALLPSEWRDEWSRALGAA